MNYQTGHARRCCRQIYSCGIYEVFLKIVNFGISEGGYETTIAFIRRSFSRYNFSGVNSLNYCFLLIEFGGMILRVWIIVWIIVWITV